MAASALSEEGFQVLTTLGVFQDNLKGWSPKQAPSVLCYGLVLGLFSSSLCSPLLEEHSIGQNEISLCWRSGVKTPELSLKYVAIHFSCRQMDLLWPQADASCDNSGSPLVYLSCLVGSRWDLSQDTWLEPCLLKMTRLFFIYHWPHQYIKDTHKKDLCAFPWTWWHLSEPGDMDTGESKVTSNKTGRKDSLGCLRPHGSGAGRGTKGKQCCKRVPGRESKPIPAGGRHGRAPRSLRCLTQWWYSFQWWCQEVLLQRKDRRIQWENNDFALRQK